MSKPKITVESTKYRVHDIPGFFVRISIEENIGCEHYPHDFNVSVLWTPTPYRRDKGALHRFTFTMTDVDKNRGELVQKGSENSVQIWAPHWKALARRAFKVSESLRREAGEI